MDSVTLGRTWLLLGLLMSFGAGCKTAPIHNVRVAVDPAPLEVRHQQIVRAAHMQGWTTQSPGPGIVIATRRKGRHTASSTIEFDGSNYSITLRNSAFLKQSGDSIHKLYNVWIQGLEQSINREMSSAWSPPAVAAQPPAASQ